MRILLLTLCLWISLVGASAQTQGISMRSTNGTAYNATIESGNGVGLTNVLTTLGTIDAQPFIDALGVTAGIQAALNSAKKGWSVQIKPISGYYNTSNTIFVPSAVHLVSAGDIPAKTYVEDGAITWDRVILRRTNAGLAVLQYTNIAMQWLRGIELRGGAAVTYGLIVSNGLPYASGGYPGTSLFIERCTAISNSVGMAWVHANQVKVENSSIISNSVAQIILYGNCDTALIKDCRLGYFITVGTPLLVLTNSYEGSGSGAKGIVIQDSEMGDGKPVVIANGGDFSLFGGNIERVYCEAPNNVNNNGVFVLSGAARPYVVGATINGDSGYTNAVFRHNGSGINEVVFYGRTTGFGTNLLYQADTADSHIVTSSRNLKQIINGVSYDSIVDIALENTFNRKVVFGSTVYSTNASGSYVNFVMDANTGGLTTFGSSYNFTALGHSLAGNGGSIFTTGGFVTFRSGTSGFNFNNNGNSANLMRIDETARVWITNSLYIGNAGARVASAPYSLEVAGQVGANIVHATNGFRLTTLQIISGSGSPNGVVTAPVGSLYMRTDGGAATALYVKEVGVDNNGWVGK